MTLTRSANDVLGFAIFFFIFFFGFAQLGYMLFGTQVEAGLQYLSKVQNKVGNKVHDKVQNSVGITEICTEAAHVLLSAQVGWVDNAIV